MADKYATVYVLSSPRGSFLQLQWWKCALPPAVKPQACNFRSTTSAATFWSWIQTYAEGSITGRIKHNIQQCAWNHNSVFRLCWILYKSKWRWWHNSTCCRLQKICEPKLYPPTRIHAIQEVCSWKQGTATGPRRGGRWRDDEVVLVIVKSWLSQRYYRWWYWA